MYSFEILLKNDTTILPEESEKYVVKGKAKHIRLPGTQYYYFACGVKYIHMNICCDIDLSAPALRYTRAIYLNGEINNNFNKNLLENFDRVLGVFWNKRILAFLGVLFVKKIELPEWIKKIIIDFI